MLYCDSRCSQTLTGLLLALTGALLCNATRRQGDRQRVILSRRVRGFVRAVRAVRNTRVSQTETMVVADGARHIMFLPIDNCIFAYLFWHKAHLSNIEYLCQDIRGIATAFVGLRLNFGQT